MQLPTPDTTQAGLVGLDGRKAEINTNTYQYLHYFAAGIIVPHQFLMLLVLWPRLKTQELRTAANLNSAQSWPWRVSEDIINCCLLAVITFVIWNMEHG